MCDRCVTDVLPTAVQEGVAVPPDHHVHPADLTGHLLVHGEARVSQSDDLLDSQREQLVHLTLQSAHLVLKEHVRS